jgi:hypothetical protein
MSPEEQEERMLLEQAMNCAEIGNASHWPTVAGMLRDEILELRARIESLQHAAFDTKENGS